MIRTFDEVERQRSSDQLVAIAQAFVGSNRSIPGHIIRRLWGLRSEWKGRTDVPAAVMLGCEALDRTSRR